MVSNSIVQTTLNRILNEIVESNHRQNAEIENPRKNIFLGELASYDYLILFYFQIQKKSEMQHITTRK